MDDVGSFKNQHYKSLLMQATSSGLQFMDKEFPPERASLYHMNPPFPGANIVWKRASEMCDNPRLFVNGPDPRNVVQGAVGNCWLVSALGVLAGHKQVLNKVIPKYEKQEWKGRPDSSGGHVKSGKPHPGIFRFRFYRLGKWIEVVVDDYLPTIDDQLVYAHSKLVNEFWVALMEKAYAKINGSYEALEAGSAGDALVGKIKAAVLQRAYCSILIILSY
jgi:hypothetical protein